MCGIEKWFHCAYIVYRKNGYNDKSYSSSKRLDKSGNDDDSTSDSQSTNALKKTYDQTRADSTSSSNTASEFESQSESKSTQVNENEDNTKIDKAQLESTKTEIYKAILPAYQLTGQEHQKTVKTFY